MTIYTGESIAEQFTAWGVGAEFVGHTISPQIITYYFNLKNPLQLQKVKRMAENLGASMRCVVTFSTCSSADFCLQVAREDKRIINIKEFAGIMRTAPAYSGIIGTDTDNRQRVETLDNLTHLLIAGTTGSGKSVAVNSFLMSLLCYNQPQNLGLLLIDLKRVEFAQFQKVPHLIKPIATEPHEALELLEWLTEEMHARYQVMAKHGITKNQGEFKKILLVIDELSDLILTAPATRSILVKLLQKARACGIHVVVATQSPRAKILDGVMLANLPSRLALTCSNSRESVLILGHKGAEKLTGRGDAILKLPNSTTETRLQVPFISPEQIKKLINN